MPTVLTAARTRSTATAFDIDAAIERLAAELAATAVERDRRGGHAAEQRQLIRDSGLLALTVPKVLGGQGADMPTLLRAVRRLARADSALAHLFGFHHLQVISLLLWARPEQQQHWLQRTIDERLFWGNALNPLDRGLAARRADGGWRLDGTKSFASGALGSDQLIVSAHVADEGAAAAPLLIGTLATHSAGLLVEADWDGFGQRQTDSGSVHFVAVHLADRDVLLPPGATQSPHASLRTLVSQLIMSHLYLGIAEAAFDAARDYLIGQARPWLSAGVPRAADDPFTQHRFGQLWLHVRPAELACDAAAHRLQDALDRGPALGAEARGVVAVAAAEAKVLSHRAALEVSSQFFELTGARSTSARLGLDRFWRNARVHTLHDPVDYKLRDIGRFRLDGRAPEPTSYS